MGRSLRSLVFEAHVKNILACLGSMLEDQETAKVEQETSSSAMEKHGNKMKYDEI